MSDKLIRTIKLEWTWDGDRYLLKGFNIAILPTGKNPDTNPDYIVVQNYVPITDETAVMSYKHSFTNLTLDVGASYTAWIQTVFENDDSDWVSFAGQTVADTNGSTIVTVSNPTIQQVIDMAADNKVTPQEKLMLKKEWDDISNQFLDAVDQCNSVNLPTADINILKNAANALGIYANRGVYYVFSRPNTPGYAYPTLATSSGTTNLDADGYVSLQEYQKKFLDFYKALRDTLNKVRDKIVDDTVGTISEALNAGDRLPDFPPTGGYFTGGFSINQDSYGNWDLGEIRVTGGIYVNSKGEKFTVIGNTMIPTSLEANSGKKRYLMFIGNDINLFNIRTEAYVNKMFIETEYSKGVWYYYNDSENIKTSFIPKDTYAIAAKIEEYTPQETGSGSGIKRINLYYDSRQSMFEVLTNGGQKQGIFEKNGLIYINAEYVSTGVLTDVNRRTAIDLDNGTFRLGGSPDGTGAALKFDGNRLTLGNNVVLTWDNLSSDAQQNLKGQDGTDGRDGRDGTNAQTMYTWIMFANDANGGGISNLPNNKTYMGIAYNKTTASPSNNPSDYSWALMKGADGSDGVSGTDGITYYTWIAYASNSSGGDISSSPLGKTHMGVAANKTSPMPNPLNASHVSQFTWSLIKGADGTNGRDGVDGKDGAPGRDGRDGVDGKDGPPGPILDWVQSWDGTKTTISGTQVVSPKIFVGSKNAYNQPIGIALGQDVFGTGSSVSGLAGYNNGIKTFHIKTDGSAVFGTSTGRQFIVNTDGSVQMPKITSNEIEVKSITTASISDNAINSIVDSVKVGGRNLWIWKDSVSGHESGGGITPNPADSHKILNTLQPTMGATNYVYQLWNPNKIVNTSNSNRVAFYDSNYIFVGSTGLPQLNGLEYQTANIPVPQNSAYVRFAAIVGNSSSRDNTILVKFERGNKATDWSPAPEDVDEKFNNYTTTTELNTMFTVKEGEILSSVSKTYTTKTDFDKLSFGGRNYYKTTTSLDAWNGATVSKDETHARHGFVISYTGTAVGVMRAAEVINGNGEWTVSGYIYSTVAGSNVEIQIADIKAWSSTIGNTAWTRFEGTVNVTRYSPDIYNFVDFEANYVNGQIYVTDFKVEKGNKATDWTPAPEDLDEKFKAYSTTEQMNTAIHQTEQNINLSVARDYTTKTDFNNLNLGGRNYLLNSDNMIQGTASAFAFNMVDWQNMRGKNVSVSVDIELYGAYGTNSPRVGYESSIEFTDGTTQWVGVWHNLNTSPQTLRQRISLGNINVQDKEIRSSYHSIYIQRLDGGSAKVYRPKFEIGSKPTDWTPAPEDTDEKFKLYSTTQQMNSAIDLKADAINLSVSQNYTTKTEFNNISVGSRNMIRNSGNFVNADNWAPNPSGGVTVVEKDGFRCLTAFRSIQGANKNVDIPLEPQTSYIYQCEIMFDRDVPIYETTPLHRWVHNANGSSGKVISSATTARANVWTTIQIQILSGSPVDPSKIIAFRPFIWAGDDIDNFWLKTIKLEKGTLPTTWTPAPEDLDDRLKSYTTVDQVNAAIDVKADAINLAVSQTYTTKTDFNNLQIGGTNLLRYFGQYTADNKYVVTAWQDDAYKFTTGRVYLEKNKQYTFSCKTDGVWGMAPGTDTVEVFLRHTTNTDWHIHMDAAIFTFTYTHESAWWELRLDVNKNGVTHSFWEVQFEEGSKATSWAPSPFDVVNNIVLGGRNIVPNSYINLTSTSYGFGFRNFSLEPNTEYTFTINGRVNNPGPNKALVVFIYENSWAIFNKSLSIFDRVDTTKSMTFTTPSNITKDIALSATSYYYPSGSENDGGSATINWIKIEKGNKSTDWSPAPEDFDAKIETVDNKFKSYYTIDQTDSKISQTATSITNTVSSTYTTKTEFNNLHIGGRNLVIKSNTWSKPSVASGITATIENDILKVSVATGNGNWMSSWPGQRDMAYMKSWFKDGEIFTVSFLMRRTSGWGVPNIYIKNGMGYYHMEGELNANTFSTVYYTGPWTVSNDDIAPHLGFNECVGAFEIKAWKIEKGNKVTDWTPAPEDYLDKQVGGANLFLNSGFTDGYNNWIPNNTSSVGVVDCSEAISGKAIRFSLPAGGGIYQRKGGNDWVSNSYPVGMKVAISCYIRCTNSSGNTLLINPESSGIEGKYFTLTNANQWYKCELKGISTAEWHTVVFYPQQLGTYEIHSTQLVEGDFLPGWAPSQVDIEKKVATLPTTSDVNNIADNKINSITLGGRNLWVWSTSVTGWELNGAATNQGSSAAQHQIQPDLTPINSNTKLIVQVWNPNKITNRGNSNRIAWFDSAKNWLRSEQVTNLDGNEYIVDVFTPPNNAKYARLGVIVGAENDRIDPDIKVMIENASKPSGWSPAPEDVEHQIDRIEVGGRNLLVGSKLSTYGDYNVIISKDNSKSIVCDWNTSHSGSTFTLNVTGYKPEKGTYTISGYVKVNGSVPSSKFFLNRINYESTQEEYLNYYDSTTGYFKITQYYNGQTSWIIHATTSRSGGVSGRVTLERLMFEKGTNASDWSNAPEDLEERVYNSESSITQLKDQIILKVDANGVKSVIQQNPESVRIGFNQISDAIEMSADGIAVKQDDGTANLSATGIEIFDNTGRTRAYFGDNDSAYIKELWSEKLVAPNVIRRADNWTDALYVSENGSGNMSGEGLINMGNSVSDVLESFKKNHGSYLVGNLDIYVGGGTYYGDINVTGFSGEGRITVVFLKTAKVYGRIISKYNSVFVRFIGNADLAWSQGDFDAGIDFPCAEFYFYGHDVCCDITENSKPTFIQCIRAETRGWTTDYNNHKGTFIRAVASTVYATLCDVVGFERFLNADYISKVDTYKCRGHVRDWVYSNGGCSVTITGTRPTAYNDIKEVAQWGGTIVNTATDKGSVWKPISGGSGQGQSTSISSTFGKSFISTSQYTEVFDSGAVTSAMANMWGMGRYSSGLKAHRGVVTFSGITEHLSGATNVSIAISMTRNNKGTGTCYPKIYDGNSYVSMPVGFDRNSTHSFNLTSGQIQYLRTNGRLLMQSTSTGDYSFYTNTYVWVNCTKNI